MTRRASPVPAEAPVTVLPLLSSALAELWDRQQDGRLTHQAYERIGGVAGSARPLVRPRLPGSM